MKKLFLSLILAALMIVPAHFAHSALVDASTVLYLPMDEGSGAVVHDQSGYGHDGNMGAGAVWADGVFGTPCLEFSGTSLETVIIDPVETLKFTGEITMAAWINVPGLSGEGDFRRNQIISKKVHDDGEHQCYGMGIFDESGFRGFLGKGAGVGRFTITATTADLQSSLNNGEWNHLALTYDGAEAKPYRNGVLMADGVIAEAFDFHGDNDWPVRIGCATHDPRYTMQGRIDDVLISSRAFSEAEIMELTEGPPSAVSAKGKLTTTWASIKN